MTLLFPLITSLFSCSKSGELPLPTETIPSSVPTITTNALSENATIYAASADTLWQRLNYTADCAARDGISSIPSGDAASWKCDFRQGGSDAFDGNAVCKRQAGPYYKAFMDIPWWGIDVWVCIPESTDYHNDVVTIATWPDFKQALAPVLSKASAQFKDSLWSERNKHGLGKISKIEDRASGFSVPPHSGETMLNVSLRWFVEDLIDSVLGDPDCDLGIDFSVRWVVKDNKVSVTLSDTWVSFGGDNTSCSLLNIAGTFFQWSRPVFEDKTFQFDLERILQNKLGSVPQIPGAFGIQLDDLLVNEQDVRVRIKYLTTEKPINSPGETGDGVAMDFYLAGLDLYLLRQAGDLSQTSLAIDYLNQALNISDPETRYDILILLSQVQYWNAKHSFGVDNAKLFLDAQHTAEKAIAIGKSMKHKDCADAYYYAGLNLANWMEQKGTAAFLDKTYEAQVLDYMTQAASRPTSYSSNGETIDGYGPDYVISSMLLAKGEILSPNLTDWKLALKHAEKAFRLQPTYVRNVVLYARILARKEIGRKPEAIQILDAYLSHDPNTFNADRVPETQEEFKKARELRNLWP